MDKQEKKSNSDSDPCKNHPGNANLCSGTEHQQKEPLAKDINPAEVEMKWLLLWFPQIPAGKAALPPLSTRIQVAALIQSWSRQAALSSLPNRNTMFMQHSSNRFQPREASEALEFSEHFARCRLAESWQGFTLAKRVFPVPGGPYIRIFL